LRRTIVPLSIGALSGALLMAGVLAQGQQPGPPGGGGFRGAPIVVGQVAGVDAANRSIAVTGGFGGDQTIAIAPNAQVIKSVSTTLDTIRAGDRVSVTGVPRSLAAQHVQIGEPPQIGFGGFGGRRGGGGGAGGAGGGGAAGARPPGPGGNVNVSMASVSGTVAGTDPFTVTTPGGAVTIDLAGNQGVDRYQPVELGEIKQGDRVFATGQRNEQGGFIASALYINLPQGAGPFGGFGGFGGGGFGRGGGFGGRRGGQPQGGGQQ
jgi:hypothetical protein